MINTFIYNAYVQKYAICWCKIYDDLHLRMLCVHMYTYTVCACLHVHAYMCLYIHAFCSSKDARLNKDDREVQRQKQKQVQKQHPVPKPKEEHSQLKKARILTTQHECWNDDADLVGQFCQNFA